MVVHVSVESLLCLLWIWNQCQSVTLGLDRWTIWRRMQTDHNMFYTPNAVHWRHWGYLRVIESYLRVIWGSDSNLVFNPGPRVCPFSFQFPEPLILLNIIFAHCWNCRSAVYLQLFLLYLLDNLSSTLFILSHWLDWFPPRIVQLHLLTAQLSVLLCLLLVTGCGGWPAASQ